MYEETSVSVQFNICTNTGSSEVVGRRIGGRQEEAKHAVECSVKSVGQLDRFEEDESSKSAVIIAAKRDRVG